jgi:predicted dehydrogenase
MLKVGLVGLGKMGKLHFMNALRMKDVKVLAVADKLKINQQLARKYGVKVYDDYRKLFDSEDLDAVIISLPNFLKKDSIFYASEKGLDIFVDKPLARNFSEAEEVIRKVRTQDVKLMVGVNYRYFDSVQKIKNILDEGGIGDVIIATSELIMDGPFSHPLVPKPIPEWWFDKEKAGGGALLDLGYHLIDILTWIFGDLEVEFSTLGYRFNLPIEDSAIAVLKSPKTGVSCVVNVGWFSKMIFPNFNFRINLHGTVGYVSTDKFVPRNPYFHAMKEGTSNLLRRIMGRKVHYLSYTYYYASFAEILNQFFEGIRTNRQPSVSCEEQLSVIKTIEGIYRQNGVS